MYFWVFCLYTKKSSEKMHLLQLQELEAHYQKLSSKLTVLFDAYVATKTCYTFLKKALKPEILPDM